MQIYGQVIGIKVKFIVKDVNFKTYCQGISSDFMG